MNTNHAPFIGVLVAVVFLAGIRTSAQSSDGAGAKGNGKSSPFNIVRSIESIGAEVLSIFGGDSKNETGTRQQNAAPGARRKTKVSMWMESGQQVYTGDQRSCTSGNGVCSFSISLADQGSGSGQKVSAQASYFPRQKRVQIEFDSPLDAQFQSEGSKIKFVIRRGANDTTDTNGTLLINNKRLLIRNGEYEVVNNTVSFFID